ncbi:MAG: putative acyl-CoA dehydrogenase [Acidimicrobiales bacterium]|nr:putative acyl-CoA dehydrogenase [Acidimicrobiales bacterium]
MSIAISEEHVALSSTVRDFLDKHRSRAAARALLDADGETLPGYWGDLANLGWLGLHLPEERGGSGFGLPELVVVVEELGRAIAPGPFVPTVIASATIAAAGSPEQQARLLPGLADGSTVAGVSVCGDVEVLAGAANGRAGAVMSGGLADVLLVPVGDDVAVVDLRGSGASVEVPPNLDPTRRSARVVLDGASAELLVGAKQRFVDLARTILAAEAVGVARECTERAAEYAKAREQFGRPIGTYQAVKHHCANMLVAVELATSLVWEAARSAADGGDRFSYAAAMAATLAVPAADLDAQLNIQVHGGIGFTWEHDAHLYLRRATAIASVVDAEAAAVDVTRLHRQGVRRSRIVDLPAEAQPIRDTVRAFVESLRDLDGDARRRTLIESGYALPHWPKPFGRSAGAIEQLVIEQELAAAGIVRPAYGITGWVILTLIQHATDDQVARWVRPALDQDVIWCQLFSEPDAGSDAAGVKAKGTRVDGGWLVNGQKVWTSGAHVSSFGLATVRTNPDAPKHQGITTMVIDMHADGVETRPLKMPTGESEFNEVFFDDVFVPDDDVVGPVDGGWTVARATLGNESVSIGGGQGGMALPAELLIDALDAHPERLAGGPTRVGRYTANTQAVDVLNLRSIQRALAGGGPGPEGNVTKLVLSENGHEAAAILTALAGPDGAFLDGAGALSGRLALMHRAMSIAGGTSEIKRNQIGERILGLPRDPLIR